MAMCAMSSLDTENHYLCACGVDRAACGACGRGWAQGPRARAQALVKQVEAEADVKIAATAEVIKKEVHAVCACGVDRAACGACGRGWAQVPTLAPEDQLPDVSMAECQVPLGYTTLVVRNIPARYNHGRLLHEFGGNSGFDFLFLPSHRDQRPAGYAFLNFRTHALALKFQKTWHRACLEAHGRVKSLHIVAATEQGLAANLSQFTPRIVERLRRIGLLPIFLDEAGVCLDPLREMQRHGIIPVPSDGGRY
eukprot:gb/GFBE01057585.1/.p1 GENE.gb/GFBE01057585.1/~~gb/GFBE01057585.1/.p1  ORF type:complete len:252 (+),score=28.57 gb/GFBE01057585.1/:1-756(+)